MNTKQATDDHVTESYLTIRRGIAIIAFLFPLTLLFTSYIGNGEGLKTSISAYYHSELDFHRDLLVGVLSAIGVFLVLYKGSTEWEDVPLTVAGVCAIGIAFFAMDKGGDCINGFSAHGVFAVTFFAAITFVCVYLSRQIEHVANLERRMKFKRWYRACAALMVISIVGALIINFVPGLKENLCGINIIFWIESIAVLSFSTFWLIKTIELDHAISWVPFRPKK